MCCLRLKGKKCHEGGLEQIKAGWGRPGGGRALPVLLRLRTTRGVFKRMLPEARPNPIKQSIRTF